MPSHRSHLAHGKSLRATSDSTATFRAMSGGARGRFGNPSQWFTYGVSVLTIGVVGFAGSFNTLKSLKAWELPFRLGGGVLAIIGLVIVILGVAVWRYNDKRQPAPAVIAVDKGSDVGKRRADLSRQKQELQVEMAKLQPKIEGMAIPMMSRRQRVQQGSATPKEIAEEGEYRATEVRIAQIRNDIKAIDEQLQVRPALNPLYSQKIKRQNR
jgi:hypothetical protein